MYSLFRDGCKPAGGDKIEEQLPSTWQEAALGFQEVQSKVSHMDAEAVKVGASDFGGLWFFGAKDQSVHCGLEASGIGNVRLCATWSHSRCLCHASSGRPASQQSTKKQGAHHES